MRLNVKFLESNNSFNAKFESINKALPAQFGEIQKVSTGIEELPKYKGQLEITPSVNTEQVIETAQKYVESDIKILKIPYFEVSNNSGGKTASIGEAKHGNFKSCIWR